MTFKESDRLPCRGRSFSFAFVGLPRRVCRQYCAKARYDCNNQREYLIQRHRPHLLPEARRTVPRRRERGALPSVSNITLFAVNSQFTCCSNEQIQYNTLSPDFHEHPVQDDSGVAARHCRGAVECAVGARSRKFASMLSSRFLFSLIGLILML